MNLFEIIVLDISLIIFPMVCYIVYMFFVKTFNQEKNNIVLDIALISSVYLSVKYGVSVYNEIPLILFDIPLIIALLMERKQSFLAIFFLLLYHYYIEFNINIFYLIISFLPYTLCLLKNKKIDCISISLIFRSILFYINSFKIMSILVIIIFYIITKFIINLFENAKSINSLYNSLQKFEEDKKSKESLFKITHEIKNPIAVVKGYLDMYDVNNSKHSIKYIPIIKEEINRVLMLLEDFLSITKIKIEKEEMDLGLLLDDIKKSFSLILKSKDIKLICKDLDEIYVCADYNRLKQVLVNLIKNSMESIDSNGVIKISVNKNKEKIKIIIEDNGKGMNEEELQQIKSAFFSTKKNGTGLGVYLSNEIIKSHDGNLKYFSKKDKGTKVVITI